MDYVKLVLEAVKEFFKNLPILDRWFTKTPTEKIEDQKEEAQDANEKTKKTGRPQW